MLSAEIYLKYEHHYYYFCKHLSVFEESYVRETWMIIDIVYVHSYPGNDDVMGLRKHSLINHQ